MDRGAWRTAVHGAANSWTEQLTHTHTHTVTNSRFPQIQVCLLRWLHGKESDWNARDAKTWVQSLDEEDLLEQETATYSSNLAHGERSLESQKSQTRLSNNNIYNQFQISPNLGIFPNILLPIYKSVSRILKNIYPYNEWPSQNIMYFRWKLFKWLFRFFTLY